MGYKVHFQRCGRKSSGVEIVAVVYIDASGTGAGGYYFLKGRGISNIELKKFLFSQVGREKLGYTLSRTTAFGGGQTFRRRGTGRAIRTIIKGVRFSLFYLFRPARRLDQPNKIHPTGQCPIISFLRNDEEMRVVAIGAV